MPPAVLQPPPLAECVGEGCGEGDQQQRRDGRRPQPQPVAHGQIVDHGAVDRRGGRRSEGDAGARFAGERIVERALHVARGAFEVVALEEPQREVVEREVGARSGLQVGDGRARVVLDGALFLSCLFGDLPHVVIEHCRVPGGEFLVPEGFQLGISFVVAAVVGQFERPFPNAGECRKGFDAGADVPDAAQRIEPCPVFAGIGGFGLPPPYDRIVPRIPVPVFERRHSGRIDLPEERLGLVGQSAPHQDVGLGQCGDPFEVVRFPAAGECVEAVDETGGRVEFVGDEDLLQVEQCPNALFVAACGRQVATERRDAPLPSGVVLPAAEHRFVQLVQGAERLRRIAVVDGRGAGDGEKAVQTCGRQKR